MIIVYSFFVVGKDYDTEGNPIDGRKKRKCEPVSSTSLEDQELLPYEHFTQPVLATTYDDPVTQGQKVVIAVAIPGAAKDICVNLSVDGYYCVVEYDWPEPMRDPVKLFKHWIDAKEIVEYHPKIIALNQELKNCRASVNESPRASIKVRLPVRVQTDSNTFTRNGIVEDASIIVIAEFKAIHSKYEIKKEDMVVDFVTKASV